MPRPFTDYVVKLCIDRNERQQFQADPHAKGQAAGLTYAQIDAVRVSLQAQNPDAINSEILLEYPGIPPFGSGQVKVVIVQGHWTIGMT